MEKKQQDPVQADESNKLVVAQPLILLGVLAIALVVVLLKLLGVV